jgi:hypothetical protein
MTRRSPKNYFGRNLGTASEEQWSRLEEKWFGDQCEWFEGPGGKEARDRTNGWPFYFTPLDWRSEKRRDVEVL